MVTDPPPVTSSQTRAPPRPPPPRAKNRGKPAERSRRYRPEWTPCPVSRLRPTSGPVTGRRRPPLAAAAPAAAPPRAAPHTICCGTSKVGEASMCDPRGAWPAPGLRPLPPPPLPPGRSPGTGSATRTNSLTEPAPAPAPVVEKHVPGARSVVVTVVCRLSERRSVVARHRLLDRTGLDWTGPDGFYKDRLQLCCFVGVAYHL